MPITISQALDLLMALVLVMFVPIGLWRGALREWIALAGITFGSLLAAKWAEPWGNDLARLLGMDVKLAQFTVAALFFLGTTLLIGYGGGITLPYRPDLTWANRILGALLGLGNGVLILGGTLEIMQTRLFDGRADSPLIASGLAQFLLNDIAWAYLGILGVLVCTLLAGLVRRWGEGTPLMEEYAPVYQATPRETWAAADWGPPPPDEAWGGAIAPRQQEVAQRDTAALQVVPAPAPAPASAAPATPPAASAGPPISAVPLVPSRLAPVENGPVAPRIVDIVRPAARQQASSATPRTLNITPITAGTGRREAAQREAGAPTTPQGTETGAREADAPTLVPRRAARQEPPAAPPPAATPAATAQEGGVICGVCGTTAAARARFCLTCGHIIGEPERRQVARHQ